MCERTRGTDLSVLAVADFPVTSDLTSSNLPCTQGWPERDRGRPKRQSGTEQSDGDGERGRKTRNGEDERVSACTRKRVSEQEREQTRELEKMHHSRRKQIFKQIFKNDAIENIQPHQQCAQEYCDKCIYAYIHTRIIQKASGYTGTASTIQIYVYMYVCICGFIHRYTHIYTYP